MSKNIFIIIFIALIFAVGVFFFINRGPEIQPSYQKESITLEADLKQIELSAEEIQVLEGEGIEIPSSEADEATEDLQSVRFSDELAAIEADLNETDLSGLDAELEAIESDLAGL